MTAKHWEKRILSEIDARSDELLGLAGDLIKIPSENPKGDCTEIANFVHEWISSRGIEADIVGPGDGHVNVVSTYGAAGERHALVSGHYDVVPAGDLSRWSFPPFAGDVVDGYLRGRGASDMKAGLAGVLFSYALLHELKVPLGGKLSFAAVCDEETGDRGGADWVLENGFFADATGGIIAEPSERIRPTIGQKGSNWFKLTILGKPGHGSLQPIHGENANLLAARAIIALQELWEMKPNAPEDVKELIELSKNSIDARDGYADGVADVFEHVTINVGKVTGGTSTNVVADTAVVEFDTRVPIGLSRAEVNARVKEILNRENIEAEIEYLGFSSEPNWTLPSDPIVAELVGVLKELVDPDAEGVLQWASSDARTFRSHGIPVLQYGPAELTSIHNFDERAKVEDVITAAKVYALSLIRYLGITE